MSRVAIRGPTLHTAVLCLGIAMLPAAHAAETDRNAQRKQFARAYQAFLAKDVARGEALSAGLEIYLLYPHLRYESLRRRLETADSAEIRRFLSANEGTYVGEQFRTAWLAILARQQRWQAFLDNFRPQQSVALRCAHLDARIAMDHATEVTAETKALWLTGENLPPECDRVVEWLARRGALDSGLVWERLRLVMAAANPTLAAQLARRLPAAEQPLAALWREVYSNPQKGLAREELKADSPRVRDIVRTGIERLARHDAGKAHEMWQRRQDRYKFSAREQAAIAAGIAITAVRRDHADALRILDTVPDPHVDAELQRARLLAALRTQSWGRIERWTEQPPGEGMNALRWRYWRARALEERGAGAAAREILFDLTQERDYYGLLAAERLQVLYTFPHQPLATNKADVVAFLARPGIERALELRRLGFEAAARQEWSFETVGLGPQGLIVAAAAAHQLGWHERAIAALGKAREFGDLEVRYPIAFRNVVEEYASVRGLEPAVMLSLIRSESAFNESARSPAGALGLMQVMPATGRQTAKRVGLTRYAAHDLLRADTNVMLGSAYLRDMLDRFHGNLAMAAAAYNAGPHRVKAWRPRHDCIEADIWVDTIPFTETRRYVRNVLYVTALYQMRLQQEIKPLRQRLSAVTAENVPSPSQCSAG
ncbi:MAG: transglycosylase SLT domain-containing protein [Chromatiales bacterium]